MGYRIDYRPVRAVRGAEICRMRSMAMTGLFFLLFLCLVFRFWPEGTEAIISGLRTVRDAIQIPAVETFAENLGSGESFASAFESFYRYLRKEC